MHAGVRTENDGRKHFWGPVTMTVGKGLAYLRPVAVTLD